MVYTLASNRRSKKVTKMDLPIAYKPKSLRPVERPDNGEVRYGIAIQNEPECFGFFHGPFSNLEDALEIVPDYEHQKTNKQICIFQLTGGDGDKILYEWDKEKELWIKFSDDSIVIGIRTRVHSVWMIEFKSGRKKLLILDKGFSVEEVVQMLLDRGSRDFIVGLMGVGEFNLDSDCPWDHFYMDDARRVNERMEIVL